MKITIKGKNIDLGDALQTHINQHLKTTVDKYFDHSIEATVTLLKIREVFTASIQVHVGKGIMAQSAADASEPYPAFDLALDKLAKRLRRYKSRLRDHHKRDVKGTLTSPYYILQAESEELAQEPSENPVVVAEMTTNIESMTVSEAVMRMDLGEFPILVFRNRAHGKLNVVYRRPDGHVGWVDPREM